MMLIFPASRQQRQGLDERCWIKRIGRKRFDQKSEPKRVGLDDRFDLRAKEPGLCLVATSLVDWRSHTPYSRGIHFRRWPDMEKRMGLHPHT